MMRKFAVRWWETPELVADRGTEFRREWYRSNPLPWWPGSIYDDCVVASESEFHWYPVK